MEATIKVLNDLVRDGVVECYAIGGAVGAIFWVEVKQTEDLDIFVFVHASDPPLQPLQHIYDALKSRGYGFEGMYMMIEGVPVQFLPADTPELLAEALRSAVPQQYGQEKTWVMSAEYLLALALHTKRGKDYERVAQFLEQAEGLDLKAVTHLIARHDLVASARRFGDLYPEHAGRLG